MGEGALRTAEGKPRELLLRSRLPQSLDEVDADLLETDQWEGEIEHVARDGRKVIVASRWALRRDQCGQPQDILVISTDITEQTGTARAAGSRIVTP